MLKKIYFENFKSFEKAEMKIEQFTTLVGTNASGKSNAIEGLKILSELATGRELSVILDGSKNMESNIRGGSRGCCRFETSHFILGCLVQYDANTDLKYMIDIQVTDEPRVAEESLYKISEDGESEFLFKTENIDKKEEEMKTIWNNGRAEERATVICVRQSSVMSQVMAKIPQESEIGRNIVRGCNCVTETLKNIFFLEPEPFLMRGYSRISDVHLKGNASNLSAVLNWVCKDEEKKKTVLRILKNLPENRISELLFSEGSLNDVVFFISETHEGKTERINSLQLSDGTLRCLAIVAALLSEKEKGMIVIEEMDSGIHPGRIQTMVQAISELAQRRELD
ncbi:MAG: ATP-binding protein, partial [Lachnospiraceae bacterium]|nr:ATP-binding protein [Lachnospiraceae bacterium]